MGLFQAPVIPLTAMETVLLATGVLLIVIVLAIAGRIPAKSLNWSSEKFGSLQLDLLPLLVLVGVGFAAAGFYLRLQANDARIAAAIRLEDQLKDLQTHLDRLKRYDLQAHLGFEEAVSAAELKVTAQIADESGKLLSREVQVRQGESANEIVVAIGDLKPEWEISFIAEKDKKTLWMTTTTTVLKPSMLMHRRETK